MKEVLEMLKSEEEYILNKIKGVECTIEAVTELLWDGDLSYEKGRLKELQDELLMIKTLITRVKYKMLKMTEGM